MTAFTLIHLSHGGDPQHFIGADDPQITATYWDGLKKVGSETVAVWMGMALCDPWFRGDSHPTEGAKDVRVTADWPIDFGRVRVLEGRMRKALSQIT